MNVSSNPPVRASPSWCLTSSSRHSFRRTLDVFFEAFGTGSAVRAMVVILMLLSSFVRSAWGSGCAATCSSGLSTESAACSPWFSGPAIVMVMHRLGDVLSSVLRRFLGGSVDKSNCAMGGAVGSAKEKPKSAVISRTLYDSQRNIQKY
jgi:hypothetical protein